MNFAGRLSLKAIRFRNRTSRLRQCGLSQHGAVLPAHASRSYTPPNPARTLTASKAEAGLKRQAAAAAMYSVSLAISAATLLLHTASAQLEFCNRQCQQSQRESLQLLYSQTSGHKWQHTDGWTTSPCGSACDSWPQHCSWSGVHCCLPVGVLGSGTPAFPSNAAVNCTMVGGVVALLMGNQHLHGAMTEEVWPALGASLKYLDLSGVDQMTLCVPLWTHLLQTRTPLFTQGCCPVS